MASEHEEGFTLVELLMVIAMTGILMTALAAVFNVGLVTTTGAGARLADSLDLQLVSTYLPGDVQNAGSLSGDVSNASSATAGCTGVAGVNVLALKWRDAQSGDTFGATYRTATAEGEQQLIRFTCGPGGPSSQVVARSLAAAGGAVADISHDPRLTMTLHLASGYTGSITAVRRTLATTDVPGPGDLTCSLTFAVLYPDSGEVVEGGLLVAPPTVTVGVSGGCGPMTARYAPNGATATSTALVGASTRTAALVSSGWTAGDRQIDIVDATGTLASLPFTVTAAPTCVITDLTTVPTNGLRSKNPAPNTLTTGAVSVNASFSAGCAAATLLFDPTSNTTTPTAQLLTFPATGATRSVSIPAATQWSDGAHTLLIKQGTSTMTQGLFNVSPATCAVTAVSLDQTTVNSNSQGKINQDVAVSVHTSGVCAGLQIGFTPANSAVRLALTESAVGSGLWNVTIDKNAYVWSNGDKVISPLKSDNTTLGTITATLRVR